MTIRATIVALGLILGLGCPAWGQLHQILRPTADIDSSSTGLHCNGTDNASTSMPNAWDAPGLSTSSTQSLSITKFISVSIFKDRVFSPWTSTSQTYTALTLSVNSSATGSASGGHKANIVYSVDGGSTWTIIRTSDSWAQITDTVTLSPTQDLSLLKVGTCVETDGDGVSSISQSVTIFDIWTDGTYSSGGGGGGGGTVSTPASAAIQPVLISDGRETREPLQAPWFSHSRVTSDCGKQRAFLITLRVAQKKRRWTHFSFDSAS